MHSFLVFLECDYHIMFLPHFDVCHIWLSTEQTHGNMKCIYFINIRERRKNDIHILAGWCSIYQVNLCTVVKFIYFPCVKFELLIVLRARDHCRVLFGVSRDMLFLGYMVHQPTCLVPLYCSRIDLCQFRHFLSPKCSFCLYFTFPSLSYLYTLPSKCFSTLHLFKVESILQICESRSDDTRCNCGEDFL